MSHSPILKPHEVEEVLRHIGFVEVRQHGSHRQYRNADGRITTVPFHQGRDISPILLHRIVREIGFTMDQFLQYQ